MSIEALIRAQLADDSAVSDIVGTRIRFAQAREGDDPPYLVLSKISSQTINAMNGPTTTFTGRIQVDIIAATYAAVKTLADAVRSALNGWTSAGAVSSCLLDNELDGFDDPTDASDKGVCRVIQDYIAWYN